MARYHHGILAELKLSKEKQSEAGKNKVCQKSDKAVIDTRQELAKIAGVSRGTKKELRQDVPHTRIQKIADRKC